MGEAFRPDRFAARLASENMADWVMAYAPASDAEPLKLLRGRFPHSPLSLRVAALNVLMLRGGRWAGDSYWP